MTPKMPLDWSLQFLWGYLQKEEPEVQLHLVANLLVRLLNDYVPENEHHDVLRQIEEGIPMMKLVNTPTTGGMQ